MNAGGAKRRPAVPACSHANMLARCAVAAAACMATPPALADEDAGEEAGAETVAPRAAVEAARPRGPGAVREVQVPRGATWLAEPLAAHYEGMPASSVIREIAQRRPIRLTFDATAAEDRLVSAPPDAVTVQDHLDAVCAQSDWAYTVAAGTVLVHDIESRVFPLATPPGRSTARMRLRGLRGGASADGGAGNDVDVGLDPYADEVAEFVRGILGLGGGESGGEARGLVDARTSVAVLPSANAVAVTAKPHQMRRIERELGRYNAITALMVRVRVTVYEVDVSSADGRSLDLAALRDAGIPLGLTVTPTSAAMSGGAVRVEFAEGNRVDGSRAVLEWLATAGRTSIAFEDAVEVRNNQVASVGAVETRQYLERFSRETQTAGAAQLDTPTVEFGELRLGWAISVQPTVAGDEVSVRIALSRSSLVEERPYSFDDGAVQGTTHVTDDYDRVVAVTLEDGETRLLTVLANSSARETRRRVPWLPWLGDGSGTAERERETVMMLTAQVL